MENTDSELHNAAWYSLRAEYLAEFMLPERYDTMKRVAGERTRYMTILAENTFHPQNVSALIRTCEAFGVQDIYTGESLCYFNPNTNIVRGSDKWVDIHRYRQTDTSIAALRSKGYRIVATTPHRMSVTPDTFDIEAGRFCIVFGTEKEGISDEVTAVADEFMMIPMYGFVESLNVSASAAIVLNRLSTRLRESDCDWNLTTAEQWQLLYRWGQQSVGDAEAILEKRFGEDR